MTTIPGPKRDLIGYEGNPPKVSWPGGARIAISLVVNYEEGSELAIGDGDATREPSGPADWPISKRDLAGEGHFEYGSRCGYWRLMDVFDEQEVKCTFYACAVALERNRDAAREMRPRGHDVMSHGWRWEDVSLLTARGGARPYPPRHRLDRQDDRRAAARLVLPLWAQRPHARAGRRGGRLPLRLRRLQRRPAVLDDGRRKKHLVFPIRWPPTTASSTGAPSARRPTSRSTSRRTSTGCTRKARRIPR